MLQHTASQLLLRWVTAMCAVRIMTAVGKHGTNYGRMLYAILKWILECPGSWENRDEDGRIRLTYEEKYLPHLWWQMGAVVYSAGFVCLFVFSDTELDMSGMASDHNSSSQEEFLPHYVQHEDPFASKLSREADIIAGFYLTVIGNEFLFHL